MKRPNTSIRIAFALAMLSASVLLCLRLVGVYDDGGAAALSARTRLCESVAIACSQFASRNDFNGIEVSLASLVQRNEEIVSAGYRTPEGRLATTVGNHENNWSPDEVGRSTHNCIFVPVMKGDQQDGRVEICFEPLFRANLAGLWRLTSVRLTLVAAVVNLLAFQWLLRRTLKHLDPSRVVPERVRSALDTMAEGLLVLDNKSQIVLANESFARTLGLDVHDLQGKEIRKLPWVTASGNLAPWESVAGRKDRIRADNIQLQVGGDDVRTFLVNTTPICDDGGQFRGHLVSFDDITEIERKNQELMATLDSLRESQKEVNAQNAKLQFLATRDPLTGSLNRRAFFTIFEENWKSAQRYRHSLSCIMVDIDHFKSINDNHGHAMGDEVLRRVAGCLNETVRETDYVCRYGGEEFCILLPHVNLDEACLAAERYRRIIESLDIHDLKVTASIGVSSRDCSPATMELLVEQADMALYCSKRTGRNRVSRFDRLPEFDDTVDQIKPSIPPPAESVLAANEPPELATLVEAVRCELDGISMQNEKVAALCHTLIEYVRQGGAQSIADRLEHLLPSVSSAISSAVQADA
jgi:diguanylate cyclase (GGDEF)-like protein/PAS domain S-box-containing protein